MPRPQTNPERGPKPTWIDADPAFGDVAGDPDDAFAIIALMNAPNIRVVGMSSVFGNTGVENAHSKLRYLVEDFYPTVEIFQGDDYPLQLNHHKKTADTRYIRESDASRGLTAALESLDEGERLTIVAIGSMVNVATVLLQKPNLAQRIEEVVVVAGRESTEQQFLFGNDPTRAFRDLNFDVDPYAFFALLSAEVPVVLAGVEVAKSMWFLCEDIQAFIEHGSPAVRYLAGQCCDWMDLWYGLDRPACGEPKIPSCRAADYLPICEQKNLGAFHPFDLFAAAWVIDRDWFHGSLRGVEIQPAVDDTIFAPQTDEERDSCRPPQPGGAYKLYLTAPERLEITSHYDADRLRAPWTAYYLTGTTAGFKPDIIHILMGER